MVLEIKAAEWRPLLLAFFVLVCYNDGTKE